MLKLNDLPSAVTALAAFLLAALAIWVPSGYSYAAVLLLLGALCFAPRWLRQPPEPATLKLALLFAGMGCMWFLLSLDHGAARWDKGIKWLLGIPCLLFVVAYPPPPKAFIAGVPLGCIGMGGLAVWQTVGQGLERATGFTNAIQWGNLALLLACMALVCVGVLWRLRSWAWRAMLCGAVVAGIGASLLSQSRGGWLALLLVFPVLLLQVRQIRPQWFRPLLALSVAAVVVVAAILVFTPSLNERMALAVTEVEIYLSTGNGNTSIGNRLDQYRLVAQMIPQKPWWGWGAHGFVEEMQRRVAHGEFAQLLLRYPQVHNDFLDVWVKVGLWGVLLQACLFAYVLYLFWPSPARLQQWPEGSDDWHHALALRVMGSLVPVCYGVFGMSQPFFNHNSGIMFFVFYVAVLWAAVRGLERGARTWANRTPEGAA